MAGVDIRQQMSVSTQKLNVFPRALAQRKGRGPRLNQGLLFAKGIRTQIKITMKIGITIKIKIKTGG